MSAGYEKYNNLDKIMRRLQIAKEDKLEEKRFVLSGNPELQRRLRKISETVTELKKDYPEIVSLNLFGSMVKGYANQNSDIDGYINIDSDLIPDDRTSWTAYTALTGKLAKNLNIQDKRISIPIKTISKAEISVWVKGMIYPSQAYPLLELFFLSVGNDSDNSGPKPRYILSINKYRKIVFDELEKMGPEKEVFWRRLISEIFEFENSGISEELKEQRRILYPWTIEEGKKYFLKDTNQEN